VDEKDLSILNFLMENARIQKTKLAEKLGVTEAAIRRRLSKLEQQSIILGYKPVVNYRIAGLAASLTGIDVEPDKLWHVVNELKKIDNIKSMFMTSGDHTLMVEIVANSVDELSETHERIEKIDGVVRVCPSVLLDVLK
jgi:Lrp/AsnC family transcriptional regulator for asnA, asnC and gidA